MATKTLKTNTRAKQPQRDSDSLSHHYLSSCSRWEKAGQVSRELWEKAGAFGLLGIVIPEEHGGIGGDLFYAAVTWEEQ